MIKRLLIGAVIAATTALTVQAGKYQNFKVSSYIRAQDVARMADDKFLNDTWQTVSSQVDLDKIYLETHRDAFTVDEKTMLKVKKFFLSKGLEVGGGITYTRSEPTDFETYSYARENECRQVKEVAEYTARLFDDFILDDFGNLYDYPAGALNIIRRAMSKDVGAYIEGPSKVALFPYDNKTLVVENFNDEAVSLRVIINSQVSTLRNLLTGQQLQPAQIPPVTGFFRYNRFFGYPDGSTVFDLQLPAHSYIGLGY